MNPPHNRLRSSARWGLLIVALLLGLTQIASSLRSLASARALGMTVSRGQAELFLRSLRARSHPDSGPPAEVHLRELLQEHAADGLRYVAVVAPDARVLAFAGAPLQATPARLPQPGNLEPVGNRLRLVAPPPMLPPPEPAHGPLPLPPPAFPDAVVLLEFEPVVAWTLARETHAQILLSSLAAVVLMTAAAFFWRMSARADRADQALARQHHLASLGEMSAVLAHEIRNPLAAAKGHAQLLAEQLPEGNRPRASADRVVHSLLRLESLINSLLDFARSAEVARRDVDPSALLADAASHLPASRIHLSTSLAPDRWNLDPLRFKQVLVNVLDNALQASPGDCAVQAEVLRLGSSLVFRIRDHGTGIPAEQLPKVFEPFHTTRVRGTGLGLAVARRIVQAHGGSIELGNHPDGGAVLTITLPAE